MVPFKGDEEWMQLAPGKGNDKSIVANFSVINCNNLSFLILYNWEINRLRNFG
jgi:hypothetical protein